MSFDDIVLPSPTDSDNTQKFDLSISFYGPLNLKYQNYFPEIFLIDATNSTIALTNWPFSFSNPSVKSFGSAVTGQVTFNWPFDTTGLVSY